MLGKELQGSCVFHTMPVLWPLLLFKRIVSVYHWCCVQYHYVEYWSHWFELKKRVVKTSHNVRYRKLCRILTLSSRSRTIEMQDTGTSVWHHFHTAIQAQRHKWLPHYAVSFVTAPHDLLPDSQINRFVYHFKSKRFSKQVGPFSNWTTLFQASLTLISQTEHLSNENNGIPD